MRSRIPLALAALVAAPALPAAMTAQSTTSAPVAQPDVFVATLRSDAGVLQLGSPRNVSARAGYDNQPAFSADGRAVFYTSTRDDAQADIYRFDLASGRTTRVTRTDPESEYSAAEVPGGGAISVIRVERDSAQRLWQLPLGAGSQSVIFPTLKPVGYHAWADDSRVVMFVLGTPPALVLGDRATGRIDTLAFNIGRSLHRIPNRAAISFVSKAYENASYVMSLDVATQAMLPLARLPEGVEDYAWLPDGRLIAGSGSTLLVCDVEGEARWVPVADLASAGLSSITRLAVSAGGDRIAIVAVPIAAKR
jgi:dipeptidyl aminopeptidase/acylaminoacyl peptidase